LNLTLALAGVVEQTTVNAAVPLVEVARSQPSSVVTKQAIDTLPVLERNFLVFYVDVGIIVYNQPRPAFYRYLQAIVDAGFADRVMFGSDQMVWPGTIERAIAVIEEAPFLSEEQKRDIFYNNAARFLRLSKEESRGTSRCKSNEALPQSCCGGRRRLPGLK